MPEYYAYCSDLKTLQEGARVWTDKDAGIDMSLVYQVKLKPWQQQLYDMPKKEREVILIWDAHGGIGKSWYWRYLRANNLGDIIPPQDKKGVLRRGYDIMCGAAGRPYTIVVDIERAALNRNQLRDIYGAIETLKTGYA